MCIQINFSEFVSTVEKNLLLCYVKLQLDCKNVKVLVFWNAVPCGLVGR
jgi:hypothetical protein